MSNLVIVAIPEENDRIWKVSSEKVPHLTLLFLGDESGAPTEQIVQFVQHAVQLSEHGPFYLDVDRRGTLGPDDADVLFFSQRSWNLKWIKQFRGQLLQNEQVRSAYDSADQFGAPQEWTPHLTLGYPLPGAPAKPLPNDGFDHSIYSVCFDRIAVWVDNYDGPEFRLEWPDREMEGDLAIAYSDTQKAALLHQLREGPMAKGTTEAGHEFVNNLVRGTPDLGEAFLLEHWGIKGMHWGARKTRPTPVAPTATSFVPHGSRRKTQIDTDGGQNHPAHPDAIKVAQAKIKLKKSGNAALSNQELGDVAKRLELEARVDILTSSKGKKFVSKHFESQTDQLARAGVREGVKRGVKKTTKFGAGLASVAALA